MCVDEKQKQEFRDLEKSEYLKQIREFAMARCVPFFWSMQENGKLLACCTMGPSVTSTLASGRSGSRITNAVTASHDPSQAVSLTVPSFFNKYVVMLLDENSAAI